MNSTYLVSSLVQCFALIFITCLINVRGIVVMFPFKLVVFNRLVEVRSFFNTMGYAILSFLQLCEVK